MSEWKPNHKPVLLWAGDLGTQWDTDRAQCLRCQVECSASNLCRCCLQSEVGALRLERDALKEVADDAERAVGLLEATIQRVRGVADLQMPATPPGMDTGSFRSGGYVVAMAVLRALDGE